MTKNFTVRLPDDVAADVEALARVEGQSVNETVKQALINEVDRKRSQPVFQERLRSIIEQDKELLDRLSK
jgi:predicted transcriptional regulator